MKFLCLLPANLLQSFIATGIYHKAPSHKSNLSLLAFFNCECGRVLSHEETFCHVTQFFPLL